MNKLDRVRRFVVREGIAEGLALLGHKIFGALAFIAGLSALAVVLVSGKWVWEYLKRYTLIDLERALALPPAPIDAEVVRGATRPQPILRPSGIYTMPEEDRGIDERAALGMLDASSLIPSAIHGERRREIVRELLRDFAGGGCDVYDGKTYSETLLREWIDRRAYNLLTPSGGRGNGTDAGAAAGNSSKPSPPQGYLHFLNFRPEQPGAGLRARA
ncbi:MAG: hypothetical protein OXU32_12205 [Gammaproteobacteria bacterium]|nr:hypothetical protein [Gammaproteobacteria bacterium]